jgi:glycosyltransferase involved in cell wall biosynthesis
MAQTNETYVDTTSIVFSKNEQGIPYGQIKYAKNSELGKICYCRKSLSEEIYRGLDEKTIVPDSMTAQRIKYLIDNSSLPNSLIVTAIVVATENSEDTIGSCLKGLLNQSVQINRIIVVDNNTNDKTRDFISAISHSNKHIQIFSIGQIKRNTVNDSVALKLAVLETLSNEDCDYVLFTEANCTVSENWTEVMVNNLRINSNLLVGSYVKITGSTLYEPINKYNSLRSENVNQIATRRIWNQSFGIRIVYKTMLVDFLKAAQYIQQVTEAKNISDYIVACYMCEIGNIQCTRKTFVSQIQNKDHHELLKELKNRTEMRNIVNNYIQMVNTV